MANWIRNGNGELVKREIVGWGRHLVSFTASPAERSLHAIEKRNGWERVAACGAPCPNGFKDLVSSPVEGKERCHKCEGIVLDLLTIYTVAA
jgi:hypothetical protein